jgi:hypothetical protein
MVSGHQSTIAPLRSSTGPHVQLRGDSYATSLQHLRGLALVDD